MSFKFLNTSRRARTTMCALASIYAYCIEVFTARTVQAFNV